MSKIELIRDELDGSVCRHITHDTGLHIYVKEMPGFTSTHALFATHYGSLNNCFRVRGEAEFSEVPEGIAHFLDHYEQVTRILLGLLELQKLREILCAALCQEVYASLKS